MLRTRLLVLLALALGSSAPRVAHACSQPRCIGGAVAPSAQGTVPANLPGLLWRPLTDVTGGVADPANVTITRGLDPSPIPFTAKPLADHDFLLVPDAPLVAGERYHVKDVTTCGDAGTSDLRSNFEVRPAKPLPTTLGTLAASDQVIESIDVSTWSGSCTSDVQAAYRTIWLTMPPETEEWVDLLQVETLVDDQPSSLKTHMTRGPFHSQKVGANVNVFRTCATDDDGADRGLGVGPHAVRMRATLPGTSLVVVSSTATIELRCPGEDDPADGSSDAGCSASGAGTMPWLGLALAALLVGRRRRGPARHR